MGIINLQELCKLLNSTQSGNNLCICVSPKAEGRLHAFFKYFQANRGAQLISGRNIEFPNPSNPLKPWKLVERIFYF